PRRGGSPPRQWLRRATARARRAAYAGRFRRAQVSQLRTSSPWLVTQSSNPAPPSILSTSSSSLPTITSSPSPPTSTSLPAPPATVSLPASPLTVSLPGPPSRSSSPPLPRMVSLPGPPLMESLPPSPQMTSSPPLPLMVSSPLLPMMTSSLSVPSMRAGPFWPEALSQGWVDSCPLHSTSTECAGRPPAKVAPTKRTATASPRADRPPPARLQIFRIVPQPSV